MYSFTSITNDGYFPTKLTAEKILHSLISRDYIPRYITLPNLSLTEAIFIYYSNTMCVPTASHTSSPSDADILSFQFQCEEIRKIRTRSAQYMIYRYLSYLAYILSHYTSSINYEHILAVTVNRICAPQRLPKSFLDASWTCMAGRVIYLHFHMAFFVLIHIDTKYK